MVRRSVGDSVAMKISDHRTRAVFDRYDIGDERDLAKDAQLIEDGQGKSDTKTDTPSYAHS
jgi:hypothetical protein